MSDFPADRDEVGTEIKKLIREKGLDSVTSKIIREHLGKVFDKDFSSFKKDVDDITRSKIDEINAEKKNGSNGANKKKDESEESASASEESEPEPSRKRGKPAASDSESDASVDSEDEKPQKKKRTKKGSDDDSDYDLASKVKKRRSANKKEPKPKKTRKTKETTTKARTGYMKECVLSDELFAVIGRRFMARSEVVKAMWAYIKEHNLYDKKNKQFIVPDETLRPIFKSKFRGFGMMKFLKNHIKDPQHLDAATLAQYKKEDSSKGPTTSAKKEESGSEKGESDGEEEEEEAKKKDEDEDQESGSGSESD